MPYFFSFGSLFRPPHSSIPSSSNQFMSITSVMRHCASFFDRATHRGVFSLPQNYIGNRGATMNKKDTVAFIKRRIRQRPMAKILTVCCIRIPVRNSTHSRATGRFPRSGRNRLCRRKSQRRRKAMSKPL